MNIAINGFGRMGRLGFRAGWGNEAYQITRINELHGSAETAAHLLEYDTVHGRWNHEINHEQNQLTVDGKAIAYSSVPTPAEMNLEGIDIVIDSTGAHRTPETLRPYLDAGAKKVIVAAPVKDQALNIVVGCNDHLYNPEQHHILTAASCTTNCIAPVIKVIHSQLGIKHGMITTMHDVTNTQTIVDAPHKLSLIHISEPTRPY